MTIIPSLTTKSCKPERAFSCGRCYYKAAAKRNVLSWHQKSPEGGACCVCTVCKECILGLSVYECRNKAKHVCILYMCLHVTHGIWLTVSRQSVWYLMINHQFQDSCDDDDDVNDDEKYIGCKLP